MLLDYVNGQTGVILRVKLRQDTTGAAPGKGITGLTSGSAGLIIGTIADNEASSTAYTSGGSTVETITTLGTYATPTASKCRFKEVDATNHPGVYEIQLANARYAVSSAKSLLVSITGVSGLMDCDVTVPLRSVNPYDGVRFGMSALPNTACTTNASLLTSGTGTDQLSVSSGRIDLGKILGTTSAGAAGYVGIDWSHVNAPTTAVNLSGTTIATTQQVDVNTIKTQAVVCPAGVTVGAFVGNATTAIAVDGSGHVTAGTIVAGAISSSTFSAGATLPRCTLVDTLTTYTNDTPQSGDAFARIGATGSGLTSLAPSATALSTTTWTGARAGYLDNLNVGGAVASHADAATIDADVLTRLAASSYTAAPSAASIAATLLTTAVPTTANTANTVADCLNAARAEGFGKWVKSGTTLTLYAPDGTTVVRQFSLDDATSPNSRT